MNIAYFSNQFSDATGHGLARYSRELYSALRINGRDISVIPISAWSSMSEFELAQLEQETGLQILPLGRKLTSLCWTFLNTPPIERHINSEVDLVHAVSLGYPVATRKPLVVTVHDLGPLTHPEYFENTSPWIMKRSLSQAIKQAAQIICVSQSTADELLSVAGNQVQARINVIHEGVSDAFFAPADPTSLAGLTLPPDGIPYILSTGKLSPRKNIHGLIRAMTSLADKIPHHLVLVGGDGWSVSEVYTLLEQSGMRDRVHLPGFVSDDQLRALYQRASVYVHPSYYEGFGLTLLEAMASGCPVVTSNVYSLPEVAGDAALLVDPTSSDDIASSIAAICTDDALASELRAKGKVRAESFKWSLCADRVADVYELAVG